MTSDPDRLELLHIARAAITAHVMGGVAAPSALPACASRRGDVFVTLHCRGELRGCIGRLGATETLAEVIRDCAVSASSVDPRFPPVEVHELQALAIELSLLGPLERVVAPHELEIGRHGLVVERGARRGLLLPQVATEWQWDRETFLAQTCRKAGLPADAWRNGATVWRFEAEVFAE